jgi:hypothetical protein
MVVTSSSCPCLVTYPRRLVDEQHLYDASLRHSILASGLGNIRELVFRPGQSELKYGAARFIRLCPQSAPMGVDNRPANRQPYPHAVGLPGLKCIEHALEMFRMDARPGIAHCHKDTCVVLLGADQQLSRRCLNRAHCFDRVQEQVQDHLLQLNAIAVNGK